MLRCVIHGDGISFKPLFKLRFDVDNNGAVIKRSSSALFLPHWTSVRVIIILNLDAAC